MKYRLGLKAEFGGEGLGVFSDPDFKEAANCGSRILRNFFTQEEKRELQRLILKYSEFYDITSSRFLLSPNRTVFMVYQGDVQRDSGLFSITKEYDDQCSGMPYVYISSYNNVKFVMNLVEYTGKRSCNFSGQSGLLTDVNRVLGWEAMRAVQSVSEPSM